MFNGTAFSISNAGPEVRTFEGGATAHMEHSRTSGLSYVLTFPGEGDASGPKLLPMIVFLHYIQEEVFRSRELFTWFLAHVNTPAAGKTRMGTSDE